MRVNGPLEVGDSPDSYFKLPLLTTAQRNLMIASWGTEQQGRSWFNVDLGAVETWDGASLIANYPIKILELIDPVGGIQILNMPIPIPFTFEYIKDDYYGHDIAVNPEEITLLKSGFYRISAMITIATVSASKGSRGNPQLHIDISQGGGPWVQQPDAMGGYIRENSTQSLSTSITGIGIFQFNAGDRFRITCYDSVPNEPDEETVPFSQRLLVEFVRA